MFSLNIQTFLAILIRGFRSVLLIVAFAVMFSTLKISPAEAALVPIVRDTSVQISTVFCSLSCYMDGEGGPTPTVSSYFFNNADLDPLLNTYESPYQTSFFSPAQIYALTSGRADSGGYGEFGYEGFGSSFLLKFSLAVPHNYELNGLLKARWAGIGGSSLVRLVGPLTQEFSIPINSYPVDSYYDIQSPISISGILPAGIYTFEVEIGGSASTIEFSDMGAEATLNLWPVPIPAALPLFLSAFIGLGLMVWRNSIQKHSVNMVVFALSV